MWDDLLQYLRTLQYGMLCNSHPEIIYHHDTILRKMTSVKSLQNLDFVFPVESFCCEGAKARICSWRMGLERLIKTIPKFSDPPVKFVSPSGGLAKACT